jgi:hypothetical protein
MGMKAIFHPNGVCDKAWGPPVSPYGKGFRCNTGCEEYDNGNPLDDLGQPQSQYDPENPLPLATADDFYLNDQTGANPCEMQGLVFWADHESGTPADYIGIWVSVYEDGGARKGPIGYAEELPTGELIHVNSAYSQLFLPGQYAAVDVTGDFACKSGEGRTIWEVTVDLSDNPMMLKKKTKYWLEILPVLYSTDGVVNLMLSDQNYLHPAMTTTGGGAMWAANVSNDGICYPGLVPAGTKRGIAFKLFGKKPPEIPVNDECENAIPIGVGAVHYDTTNATWGGDSSVQLHPTRKRLHNRFEL